MCDYSLQSVASRPAAVGEKLVTKDFGTGTRGFVGQSDPNTAVCVLPGTEIAFDQPVQSNVPIEPHRTAIFRQVNKDVAYCHHDALELPNGQLLLLTYLFPGQTATVLQLPMLETEKQRAEARRLDVVG